MSYVEFHLVETSRGILQTVSFFLDVEVIAHSSMIAYHQGKMIVVEFLIAYASLRSWNKTSVISRKALDDDEGRGRKGENKQLNQ